MTTLPTKSESTFTVTRELSPLVRYGAAIGAVFIAWAVREAFTPLWGATAFPFIFFYPAVALAAWFGRLRPALLAITLSALAAEFFFVDPVQGFIVGSRGFVAFVGFTLGSFFIAVAIERMHVASARVQHELKERQKTEKALRESEASIRKKEAELEHIINQTPFMLTRCGADLRYGFISPAYAEMLGRPADQINGQLIQDVIGDDAFDTIRPHVETVLSGQIVEYEAEIPFQGIGTRFLQVIYTPDRNDHGRVRGWIASIRDITQSKRVESSLAESLRREQVLYRFVDRLHRAESEEKVYEAAIDSIFSGLRCDRASILLFDDSGVMRFVAARGLSDEYCRAVEGHSPWSASEIDAQPISISDIDAAALEESLRQVIGKEGIRALNFIPLVTGSRLIGKFMFYYNSPHVCGTEELDLSLNIGRQLAFAVARKRTDNALRENEERLRLATETGKVGIWDWDVKSDRVFWTDSLYEVHGLEKGEFGGTVESFAALVHPEDLERVSTALNRSVERAEPYQLEFRLLRPNGEVVWIFTSAVVFCEGGKTTRMLGATIDITDAKAAEADRETRLTREQELRYAAEESNRLKDEFLAIMSHELRNPLNVVLGYSELLVRSKEISELPHLQRMAEAIKRNAVTQAKLIRDLLDLSRLRSGKLDLNREVVSVMVSVNNAVDTVREEASAKNISISVTASDESLMVDADPVRLEQIVWNLLNNAVKFTPNAGIILIRLATRDDKVVITVKDTGQGIDPGFLPHVFEIFRQADTGTKRAQSGMGIGLAVVKQLVELHGGEITAHSSGFGQGAEFSVTLPLSTKAAAMTSRSLGSDVHELCNLRVLVLDDCEDTSQMLRNLLLMNGAEVVATTSGGDALRIAKESEFDVIVSDISMPGMDGFEFLRNLKLLPRNASVPILALTGYGRVEDIERVRAEGFHSHLTKPLDFDLLMKALKELPRRTS